MSQEEEQQQQQEEVASEVVEEAEPESLSLDTCTPKDLSEFLLTNRFSDNAVAAATFLQTAFRHCEKKSHAMTQESNSSQEEEFSSPLLQEPMQTSVNNPRMGKVTIQLASDDENDRGGLLAVSIKNPQQQLHIPKGSVSHLIVFPTVQDCKLIVQNKTSGKPRVPKAHLVLLKLSKPVTFQNKAIDQVCFALPWNKTDGPTGPQPVSPEQEQQQEDDEKVGWRQATDSWRHILTQALKSAEETMSVSQVRPTFEMSFKSHEESNTSTTTSGMPFVRCYHGVQDGVLYPLKAGLLFFKPPTFLPREKMEKIACGRGSSTGQSNSRYIDINIVKDSKETVEFTNIQREELNVLDRYIHNVLIPAMEQDIKSEKQGGDSDETSDEESAEAEADDVQEENVEESDSEDDENFVQGFEDSDEENADEEEDEGIPVVQDDFAQEMLKKRKEASSETESETDDDDSDAPPKRRLSKRLREAN